MLSIEQAIDKSRTGPLWVDSQFRDTKDPCPVFDGTMWHIFGSGGDIIVEEWSILHATAPTVNGPWTEQKPVVLKGLKGLHVAAPGVVYDKGAFHMFVQTEFLSNGGRIEYLISKDGGNTFKKDSTALQSIADSGEAALYDPHPAIIGGQKYISYSGSPFIGASDNVENGGTWVGQPDIFLAKSESNNWAGPWIRMGNILDHHQVVHHNQPTQTGYEWGLEGSQLIELPNGIIMMNVVCFLPYGEYGTRQRIFFAFAEKVTGPYYSAGVVLPPPAEGWESGENGHATAFMYGFDMILFYQGRPPKLEPWRYGIATFDINKLQRIGKTVLSYHQRLHKATKQRKSNELTQLAEHITHSDKIITITDYTRQIRAALRANLRLSKLPIYRKLKK